MTDAFSKDKLLSKIEKGWNDITAYLETLTEAQLTTPTDAGGWTAKDHIIHLAVWEDGMNALFNMQPRREAMGIDEATWKTHDDDQINAVIYQRHRDMPLDEVMATFHEGHQRFVEKLRSLSQEDLERPYRHYQPDTKRNAPVWNWVEGNTFRHYAMHKRWIAAIVEEG